MIYERLVAPREHLGLLIEPDAAAIRAALQSPPPEPRVMILDQPLDELRASLRSRLELGGPVVLTGHQVEFFHAGVFAKNIAAALLARRAGGSGVFLSVDEDVPKSVRLSLPQRTAAGLRRIEVELPDVDPRLPAESQPPASREHWLQFFTRIASIYASYENTPLRDFWTAWLAGAEQRIALVDAFGRAREAVERSLGVSPLRELRVSQLAATPEFRAFAAHLMLNASALAAHYNAALESYRRRHRVRARLRPMPPLRVEAGRVELPLWLSRPGGVRQRLQVEPPADAAVVLYADGEAVERLPASSLATAAAADDALARLDERGWRLRPRALALSGFARVALADLFIHGVGGAKYDEVTAEFLPAFLGCDLRPACCVSATLRLPLERDLPPDAALRGARRESRDLRFNPQRYVRGASAELLARREALIALSRSLREQRPSERPARRQVFDGIRRINSEILRCDPWRPAELDQRVAELEQLEAQRRIAQDREYFFALHPREHLIELASRIAARLAP
ncbi:hypothetical protein RAS1_02080 [Phycisphaerae bacterium RAS1]|nr:hypothetical protein RAS1_02080 [Phycisphaerae bacterium RAS1]